MLGGGVKLIRLIYKTMQLYLNLTPTSTPTGEIYETA